ncbi:MAG: glycerophosphodiester phosphodiesterase family protein [Clostridia bacterium]|nr:glycerophosphodiester phosphodiesterase family protein [Clostridia bacterium]
MKFDLFEKAKENIIVVAHRGACGGNIPCNTLTAYEIALMQGADMIEVDVSRSKDDKLFLFHPRMEEDHFNKKMNFKRMKYENIAKERYVNYDNAVTQFGVSLFDDFLEQFKGRCFINIDKFWDNPEMIYRAIKRHNMLDQVLVKSKLSSAIIKTVEDFCPDVAFMPVVRDSHPYHEELMKRNINYVGAEVLFEKDDSYMANSEFIEKMHADGKLVWVNSIIYDYTQQLAGGHSDDTAFTVSRDYGWGWLAERGYDMIQTDWALMLIDYLKSTDMYYKK